MEKLLYHYPSQPPHDDINNPPGNILVLTHIRFTNRSFKKDKTREALQAELLSLISFDLPHLLAREFKKKSPSHQHLICYTNQFAGLDKYYELFREYLSDSSAYMVKIYDYEHDGKSVEHWFGYPLKEALNTEHVLATNLTNEKQEQCYNMYKQGITKTTDDMLLYVLQHYPNPTHYEAEWLLDVILDYHKHSKKVYDYQTIIKREFHLARLLMFESVERKYAAQHCTRLLGLL